jgi:hypothetical protein
LVAWGTLIKVKVSVVQSIPLLEAMMVSRVKQISRDNDGRVCTVHELEGSLSVPLFCRVWI